MHVWSGAHGAGGGGVKAENETYRTDRTYGATKRANQCGQTRNAVVPRGGLPDNGQKARLCILAKEAYGLQFLDTELQEWRRAAPSCPDAGLGSGRPRGGGRESKFPAVAILAKSGVMA